MLALTGLLLAAAPVSLAMPDLNAVNLAAGEGGLYSELLAQKLVAHGFKVLTARDIGVLLGLDAMTGIFGVRGSPTELLGFGIVWNPGLNTSDGVVARLRRGP